MEERVPSGAAGYLLSKPVLLGLLAVIVVAAWLGQVIVVLLLGLVLSAAGLSKLWSRLSLSGVSCQRTLSEQRVFPGEDIELKLRVVNRKLLPLPHIQVDDEIPLSFVSDSSLVPSDRQGFGLLSRSTALLWYTRVSWRQTLKCHKRGYYPLGPVTLSSGDIFGFYPRSHTEQLIDHVIVYPKIYPVSRLGIPSLHPLGESISEQRIFGDPSRVIGVRDYTPHDSLRHVHWKATARHQRMQVKVFEPTTTLKVALFLAADSFRHNDVLNDDDFELGISTAASLASYLRKMHIPVGFFTNSCQADSGQTVRILPGSGNSQLMKLLEAMAKMTDKPDGTFEAFLHDESKSLPYGTTSIFIIGEPSLALADYLAVMRKNGQKVLVVQVGDSGGNVSGNRVDWHNVKRPDDFMMS